MKIFHVLQHKHFYFCNATFTFTYLQEVGYNYGRALFSTWIKKDLVKELFLEENTGKMHQAMQDPHQHVSETLNCMKISKCKRLQYDVLFNMT